MVSLAARDVIIEQKSGNNTDGLATRTSENM